DLIELRQSFKLCRSCISNYIINVLIFSFISSVKASALMLFLSSDIFTLTKVTSPSKHVFSLSSSNRKPQIRDEDFSSFTHNFLVSVSPKRAAFLHCTFTSTVGITFVSCIFEKGLPKASSNQSSTNPFNISKNRG